MLSTEQAHRQLELNLAELSAPPPHWVIIKDFLSTTGCQAVVDVGCGVGSLSAYLTGTRYIGIDGSHAAIELARATWPQGLFETMKWEDMTGVPEGCCLMTVGMLVVIPDPEACVRHLLSLGSKWVILSKVPDRMELEHAGYEVVDERKTDGYRHFLLKMREAT